MDELVFAIPTAELWNLLTYTYQGFIKGNSDILKKIVRLGQFRRRNELEEDPSFKQIIPYALISFEEPKLSRDGQNQSYLLFRRTSGQTEQRLHNKYTLGVGGHMNPGKSSEPDEQYITDELKREFFEELRLSDTCSIVDIQFIGFINDETIPVSRVHTGLLFNILVSDKDVYVRETDKMTATWIEKSSLASHYDVLETWSKIAYDHYINGGMAV